MKLKEWLYKAGVILFFLDHLFAEDQSLLHLKHRTVCQWTSKTSLIKEPCVCLKAMEKKVLLQSVGHYVL